MDAASRQNFAGKTRPPEERTLTAYIFDCPAFNRLQERQKFTYDVTRVDHEVSIGSSSPFKDECNLKFSFSWNPYANVKVCNQFAT
jgi:hypothetical protein